MSVILVCLFFKSLASILNTVQQLILCVYVTNDDYVTLSVENIEFSTSATLLFDFCYLE